jgi:hypothetical protein
MTLRTSTASPKACPGVVRAGTLEARAGDEILEETLCAIGLPGRREGRLARREAIEETVDLRISMSLRCERTGRYALDAIPPSPTIPMRHFTSFILPVFWRGSQSRIASGRSRQDQALLCAASRIVSRRRLRRKLIPVGKIRRLE